MSVHALAIYSPIHSSSGNQELWIGDREEAAGRPSEIEQLISRQSIGDQRGATAAQWQPHRANLLPRGVTAC